MDSLMLTDCMALLKYLYLIPLGSIYHSVMKITGLKEEDEVYSRLGPKKDQV